VVWLPALCRKMGVPYCIVKVGRDAWVTMQRMTSMGAMGSVQLELGMGIDLYLCFSEQGKARLGQVVHKKNATALAITAVKNVRRRNWVYYLVLWDFQGAGQAGGVHS
jgi:hypothetical protein